MDINNTKNGKRTAIIGGASVTTIISLIMYINTQVSGMKDEMLDRLNSLETKEEVSFTRAEDILSEIKEELNTLHVKLALCQDR